jgi:hypothetical protein
MDDINITTDRRVADLKTGVIEMAAVALVVAVANTAAAASA